MTIRAVLFDYSGVMTENFSVPTENTPYDIDAVYTEMAASMMNQEAHPWHELERREMSLADWIAYVESRVVGAGALFEVGSEFNVMANLALRADRVALVQRLRSEGLAVALVTNNVAEWQPLWLPNLPPDLFDLVIDSSAVGCRKPEPEIYRLALEGLGVAASDAVFVDDFPWNVEGAEAVGLRGVHCGPDVDLDAAVRDALSS